METPPPVRPPGGARRQVSLGTMLASNRPMDRPRQEPAHQIFMLVVGEVRPDEGDVFVLEE